jgi:hypothetical protein
MNAINVTEDTLDRLAKAIMQKHLVRYSEALRILSEFRLNLICDNTLTRSAALQAALLTAVNTGKRAFHGGVFVSMPANVKCLLNWPGDRTLNEIVRRLSGNVVGAHYSQLTQTIYFGLPDNPVEDSFAAVCSGWRGGIVPANAAGDLHSSTDFALGGVVAGALGVAQGFARISGLSSRPLDAPQGISLWRPDLDWTSREADGPRPRTSRTGISLEFSASPLRVTRRGAFSSPRL